MAESIVLPPNMGAASRPAEKKLPPAEGRVRVGPLSKLPALVREFGGDPALVFADAGFNVAQFADPDTEVSFVAASRLLTGCVAATGCDALGLLLGERTDPSSLGVAGFMLKSAANVGEALSSLVRYLDLHDRGAVASLNIQGDQARFGYTIHLSGVESSGQIYDLAMTIACGIMRSICGSRWQPTKVHLSRKKPADPVPYRRFFQAPVFFDTLRSELVFASRWLGHPLVSADPLLHRYLEIEAGKMHASLPLTLVGELQRLLLAALPEAKQGAGDIAKMLGMHERTLHRKLRSEGATYRQVLEAVRYEMARQLLALDSLSLGQIAAALGYANVAAFSRAFKRWSGVSPRDWRATRAPG